MIIACLALCLLAPARASQEMPTLAQWVEMTQESDPTSTDVRQLVSYNLLLASLQRYIEQQKSILSGADWLGAPLDTADKKLAAFSYYESVPITPIVFKLIAPTGSSFYFWGDLHGDIRALAQSLQKLVDLGVLSPELDVLHENAYLFFLGDITDRGYYASEVITLLTHLAARKHNAQHVFLIRGNHEDISINAHYAFMQELNSKFSKKFEADPLAKKNLVTLLAEFYNLMPVAGFVGCNNDVIQCCHGGIEPGYNPAKLLNSPCSFAFEYIQELSPLPELLAHQEKLPTLPALGDFWRSFNLRDTQKPQPRLTPTQEGLHISPACAGFWRNIPSDEITGSNVGFMWSDFNGSPLQPEYTLYNHQRGIMYGATLTDFVLDCYSRGGTRVRGFVRGHQHNETLPGLLAPKNNNVFRMWSNKVTTTIATSQFETGSMAFVCFRTAPTYENWHFTRYSKSPKPKSTWQVD